MFEWRNDPLTCANSINTELVKWQDHLKWLSINLTKIYIAEFENIPIGAIRIDGNELSWTIAPEARGKGYAQKMIRLVFNDKKFARIKKSNMVSLHIARKLSIRIIEI